MKPTKSILQDYEEQPWCYECGRTHGLSEHHLIYGNGKRLISEKHGLKVLLCTKCHDETHRQATKLHKELQELGQRKFEESHTREEFVRIFGKNYL